MDTGWSYIPEANKWCYYVIRKWAISFFSGIGSLRGATGYLAAMPDLW